jgi:hypothetical protein
MVNPAFAQLPWGNMALHLPELLFLRTGLSRRVDETRCHRAFVSARLLMAAVAFVTLLPNIGRSQFLVRPREPGSRVSMLPSDLAVLEAGETRKDLACDVTSKKPEVGFDLRFHAYYDVSIPLKELEGDEDMLTIVFRVFQGDDKPHPQYFSQHIRVPAIEADARGDAQLHGGFDLGEGSYHVDWLMRDRAERVCASSWDVEAALPAKDKPMTLFLPAGHIDQVQFEPFVDDPIIHRIASNPEQLNIKLLVNFAPQNKESAVLQPIDTAALISILKAIDHDSRIQRVSLIAFNLQEERVLFRQDAAEHIDFPALGKALHEIKPGVVDLGRLSQKHGETDFLSDLIEKELGAASKPDAVIFAGPKAILQANVPQEDLRRIGEIECPLFYMNYNLYPQEIPWSDSISHAVKYFKGTEYTISKPRDLWFATSEMVNRIAKSKHLKTSAALTLGAR